MAWLSQARTPFLFVGVAVLESVRQSWYHRTSRLEYYISDHHFLTLPSWFRVLQVQPTHEQALTTFECVVVSSCTNAACVLCFQLFLFYRLNE